MTEKKTTTKKATATKATTAPKAATATKKTATTQKAATTVNVNAENVGFRAGDVYQALAAANKAMTVAEISKAAKISTEETYLGIGWLFKEGKVKGEDNLIALA